MTSNALQPAALGNVTPRCSPNAIRLSGDVLRNVSRLSDAELTRSLCALVRRDHQVTADLLIHLGELDARRLYAAMGYSSLFGYCVTALSFSEDVAYKRVAAARIARRYPVVLELVAGGKIHLSALLLVAPHLTPGGHQELLSAACGKSKREVERLVAERFPRPDVKTSVRKLPERSVVRNNGAGAGAAPGEGRGLAAAAAVGAAPGEGRGLAAAAAAGAAVPTEATRTTEAAVRPGPAMQPAARAGEVRARAAHAGPGAIAVGVAEPNALRAGATAGVADPDAVAVAVAAVATAGATVHETVAAVATHPDPETRAPGLDVGAPGAGASVAERTTTRADVGAPGAGASVAERTKPAAVVSPRTDLRLEADRPSSRPRIEPLAPKRFRVTFTASELFCDKLERARALASHAVPPGDLAGLLERALDALIANEEKRRFAVRPSPARESKRVRVERRASTPRSSSASATPRTEQDPGRVRRSSSDTLPPSDQDPGRLIPATGRTNPSRYIPAHVLRAVWERDQGRCTYVDPVTGRRCDERRFVEIDHAEPHTFGGPATVDNLRMTCRTHNQYAARLLFGERYVEAAARCARARGAKGAG